MRDSKNTLISELAAFRRAIEQEARFPLLCRERSQAWERQYAKKTLTLAALEVRNHRKKYRI